MMGFAPTQAPSWQESLWVQASPSEQALPSAWFGLEHVPLAGSQIPATWHWSSAGQTPGFAPMQLPAWQVSVCVQASPSAQALPSAWFGLEHVPLAGSQTPATWHWSSAVQTTGFLPLQAPARQVSVWVQASPSSQTVPFGRGAGSQLSLASWHTPVLQASPAAEQSRAAPPQTPAAQRSFAVQKRPSSQAVPSAWFGLEQAPFAGLQTPATWHWSRAVQMTGLAPMQLPAWQVSVCVQASPSEQALPSALSGLEQVPFAGSQTPAAWHWSRAAHTTGFVPVQVPAWQASVCVQALLSLQALPFGLSGFEQVPLAGSQTPATWH